jgi:excisionase family DNA binding protein
VAETTEILTIEETAALLRVAPTCVKSMVRNRCKNPLPYHRVGKYLRFRRSEVLTWFDGKSAQKRRRR